MSQEKDVNKRLKEEIAKELGVYESIRKTYSPGEAKQHGYGIFVSETIKPGARRFGKSEKTH